MRVYSGAPWEKKVAYCRAIRRGNHVMVSGTTSVDESGDVIGEDVFNQSKFIFAKIGKALQELEADFSDVVRTRAFMTNIDQFDGFAQAHKQFFAGIDPAASCYEISSLVNKDLLIEIEVDAIVEE